jgi:murein DD-endopeptidase MepM/ murein hydrolase activator NlpD
MIKVQTGFHPAYHGFLFKNEFSEPLPIVYKLPFGGSIETNQVLDGLCGGMCFTALDYYYGESGPPSFTDPADVDLKLRVYINDRHLEVIKIEHILEMLQWMVMEEKKSAARMARYEIPKLKRTLEKGEPVPLILIRENQTHGSVPNHCVVAYGYALDEENKNLNIQVYDPNYPDQETNLSVTPHRSENGFSLTLSEGDSIMAFFSIPYQVQKKTHPLIKPEPQIAFSLEPGQLPGFKLHWPVDSHYVNQYFNENPQWYKPFKLPGHEGLDLFAISGANIYAAADGVVYQANFPSKHPYGQQIRIKHNLAGKVVHTIYAHLSKILVQTGQKVSAGELIGLADNTGNSQGAHLHLTLKIEGETTPGYPSNIVDPWPYLQNGPILNPDPSEPLSGITVFTKEQLNMRAAASISGRLLTTLPAAESLQVFGDPEEVKAKIGVEGEWLHVQTAGNLVGYVAAWYVQSSEQAFPPSDLVVYPFDEVNLRSGPSIRFELLDTLKYDDPLIVLGDADLAKEKLGQQNEWVQVQTQTGQRGFVAAWLVHTTGEQPPPAGLVVHPFILVNVRARPTIEGNILCEVTDQETLVVLGDQDEAEAKIGQQDRWLNVKTPQGFIGYVAAWLVQKG